MSKRTFNERCYAMLKKVPKGKITTYAALAESIGSKAYRAVGNAMNRNPNAPAVPCHRVIKSNGDVGEYAFGRSKKISMLRKEGIPINSGRVQDLSRYLYKFD